MMSQHSNSLATAAAAILVHNENLLRRNGVPAPSTGKKGLVTPPLKLVSVEWLIQANALACWRG